jgi:hypothetical protein
MGSLPGKVQHVVKGGQGYDFIFFSVQLSILTNNPYLSNIILFISIYSPSRLVLTVAVILTSRWKTLSLGPKMLGKPFQSAAHHAQRHKLFFRVN